MKSLSLSIPHVIIMVGIPGAGKSFFAERFANTFSAPLVSWDALRDELLNEPTYSRDEDAIIKRVADHALHELLKTKATILYDGDMTTQAARRAFAQTVRAAGYEPLFVWVQTDAASAKSRADKLGIPPEIQTSLIKRFTPLKTSDPAIVISGKHTYASQLKVVLRRLSLQRTAGRVQKVEREATPTGKQRVRIQ